MTARKTYRRHFRLDLRKLRGGGRSWGREGEGKGDLVVMHISDAQLVPLRAPHCLPPGLVWYSVASSMAGAGRPASLMILSGILGRREGINLIRYGRAWN